MHEICTHNYNALFLAELKDTWRDFLGVGGVAGLSGQGRMDSLLMRNEKSEFRMTKAERLLYLINLIRSHHNQASKDLARKCGVSERTIFRDINSLASAGLPIYCDRGYRFLEGAFLPTINLTEEEFSAVEFAFEFSPLRSEPSLSNLAKGICAKLRANGGKPLPEKPGIAGERAKPASTPEMRRFSATFKLLNLAIDRKRAIRIEYEEGREGIADRLIEPYALVHKNPKWLVLCYCENHRKIVSYDVSRIKNGSLTNRSFKSRNTLDQIFTVHK